MIEYSGINSYVVCVYEASVIITDLCIYIVEISKMGKLQAIKSLYFITLGGCVVHSIIFTDDILFTYDTT